MLVYEKAVEEKISRAIEAGELSNLPGQGLPLVLDDSFHVPESLRLGFRILKNAGMTPSQIQIFSDIKKLQQQVKLTQDDHYKSLLIHQISLLRTEQELS